MMNPIKIEAEVGLDHRLIDALPPEVPIGRVRLIIEPVQVSSTSDPHPLTRDEARARLLSAGKLVTDFYAPDGVMALTLEERRRMGQLTPNARPSEELIDEDRGSY